MAAINQVEWATLEPLLDEVLELPESERAAWLAELRTRLPDTADRLETLLAADLSSDGDILGARTDPGPGSWAENLPGQTIGHYTLIRPIGHGGMGTVWLGRRQDGRFESEVAIKLLNIGLIGRSGEDRFT